MPERITKKVGDVCSKCSKPMEGHNLLMRGFGKTQVACAGCYNGYMREVMADRRHYAEQIQWGYPVRESREREVTYGKDWFYRYKRYILAYREAKAEKDQGCTVERLEQLKAEFNGKTWDQWTPANGR